MALFPDIRTELPYEEPGDRRSRIASGVITAAAHLAIVLMLLLTTWQTMPKTLSPPMTVTYLPAPPKPSPAPPGIRPRFIAPQSVVTEAPQFTITVTPESTGSGAAATSTAVAPPKPVKAPPAILAPTPGATAADDLGPYYKRIVSYLQARLHTPFQKGREGQELTATVHVISDRDGHVRLAALYISSGFDDLDEEAVGVVNRSDPLPPMPPEIRADHIDVNIPVVFSFQKDSILIH